MKNEKTSIKLAVVESKGSISDCGRTCKIEFKIFGNRGRLCEGNRLKRSSSASKEYLIIWGEPESNP